MAGATRRRTGGPRSHEIDDGRLELEVRELEHVLGVGEEAMCGQQAAELADLVEEEIRVPVLAIELVPLDIGENAMRQRDHLVVRTSLLVAAQQFAVLLDQLATL